MRVTAIILVGFTVAQAEPNTLTLACTGTATYSWVAKPQIVSRGIILNFTTGKVQGFDIPGWIDFPAKITAVDDVKVEFTGFSDAGTSKYSLRGSMDRVSGDVGATSILSDTKGKEIDMRTNYALKCKPTQRMF